MTKIFKIFGRSHSNGVVDNYSLNSNSNYKYHIYGEGAEKSKLLELGKKNNVNLNIHNRIENADLLDKYGLYKFYLIPSFFEGNPKSMLEAMSKGCIPLLSDIPHHREIIDNEFNGYLFQPGNNELIEYLEKLNKNMELSNELSKNAYESVVRNNSIEKLVFENLNDFKNVYKFNPK